MTWKFSFHASFEMTKSVKQIAVMAIIAQPDDENGSMVSLYLYLIYYLIYNLRDKCLVFHYMPHTHTHTHTEHICIQIIKSGIEQQQ